MDVCNAIEEAVVDVTIEAEEGVVWDQGQLCGGGWPPSEVLTSEAGPDPEEPSSGGVVKVVVVSTRAMILNRSQIQILPKGRS